MTDERRKHQRFTVSDNAFVALNFQQGQVAKIRDISMGGTSFDVLTTDDLETMEHEPFPTLDIFLFGNDFRLSNIPCSIVYQETPPGNPKGKKIFSQLFINKQCAVEFQNLDQQQEDSLSNFLAS
ncbi:MAG: PilZ domain-containing protein, partial [Pseudomonadota bacterium]